LDEFKVGLVNGYGYTKKQMEDMFDGVVRDWIVFEIYWPINLVCVLIKEESSQSCIFDSLSFASK
jgi:hypothetical protein